MTRNVIDLMKALGLFFRGVKRKAKSREAERGLGLRLGLGRLPKWVMNLSAAGVMVKGGGGAWVCRAFPQSMVFSG